MNRLFPLALAALCLSSPVSAQITSFQHIILVIQENRTPDNLFQGLCPTTNPSACSTKPGPRQYNIQTTAWLDKTSPTATTNPAAVPFGVGYDLNHTHAAFVQMCDLNSSSGACRMDGAAYVRCLPQTKLCPTRGAFGYVDNSAGVLNPYLDLVKAYGWGNYMFQTNQGASFPAHQFLFGATSAPSADDDHNGNFASENSPVTTGNGGCASAPGVTVPEINAKGIVFANIFPCFERRTLSDLLETQGVPAGVPGHVGPRDLPCAKRLAQVPKVCSLETGGASARSLAQSAAHHHGRRSAPRGGNRGRPAHPTRLASLGGPRRQDRGSTAR